MGKHRGAATNMQSRIDHILGKNKSIVEKADELLVLGKNNKRDLKLKRQRLLKMLISNHANQVLRVSKTNIIFFFCI